MKYFTSILITISLLIGCKESEKTKPTEKVKVSEENTKSTKEIKTLDTHQVVVIEKVKSGGYVYLKVLEKEKEYWMAIPDRQIEIGATYYYEGGMEMRKFESKKLKRTFESVIFAQGVTDKKGKTKTITKKNITEVKSKVKIEKASNGIRIAELFENPKLYQNKQVIIKGKVVKVNNGIMGVNFIHLQDGTTGNDQYDVTITSDNKLKVGEVVTIKGTAVLNKDFGAGYVYDVLIEKAVVL